MNKVLQGSMLCGLTALISAGCATGAYSTKNVPPEALSATGSAEAVTLGQKALDAYTAAVNTLDVESMMPVLSDDVIFLPPNESAVVGKAAARRWMTALVKGFVLHEEQTTADTLVAGEWLIVRTGYKVKLTPRNGGAAQLEVGKGIVLFHHDTDGRWRVARDVWNSDLPAVTK